MQQRVERTGQDGIDRRVKRRDEAEFVLSVSSHLATRDQALVEFIYGQGHSAVDYARLVRCSTRTAQQRIRNILERISSTKFRYLLAHENELPREYRAVARRLILEGHGLRTTARLTGRSLHQVRQQRLELLAILDTQCRRGATEPPRL